MLVSIVVFLCFLIVRFWGQYRYKPKKIDSSSPKKRCAPPPVCKVLLCAFLPPIQSPESPHFQTFPMNQWLADPTNHTLSYITIAYQMLFYFHSPWPRAQCVASLRTGLPVSPFSVKPNTNWKGRPWSHVARHARRSFQSDVYVPGTRYALSVERSKQPESARGGRFSHRTNKGRCSLLPSRHVRWLWASTTREG
jgi:hypothetical protein